MIYITQLIFVKVGKEDSFLQFEEAVIPLMEAYNGKVLYRLRPNEYDFVSGEEEKPNEIHFISFDSEEDLQAYLADDRRLQYKHLKDESVRSILLVKGQKM